MDHSLHEALARFLRNQGYNALQEFSHNADIIVGVGENIGLMLHVEITNYGTREHKTVPLNILIRELPKN